MRGRFARFVVVGLFNTFWSYLLYAAFLYIGLSYGIASLLTIIISVAVGFLAQGTFVFGGARREALPRFILVWIAIYLAYIGVIRISSAAGLDHYVGGLIGTPVAAVLSYFLQLHYVFRSRRIEP